MSLVNKNLSPSSPTTFADLQGSRIWIRLTSTPWGQGVMCVNTARSNFVEKCRGRRTPGRRSRRGQDEDMEPRVSPCGLGRTPTISISGVHAMTPLLYTSHAPTSIGTRQWETSRTSTSDCLIIKTIVVFPPAVPQRRDCLVRSHKFMQPCQRTYHYLAGSEIALIAQFFQDAEQAALYSLSSAPCLLALPSWGGSVVSAFAPVLATRRRTSSRGAAPTTFSICHRICSSTGSAA